MRNDAHDELDHVPSLSADPRDRDEFDADLHDSPRPVAQGRAAVASKGAGTGPLWALIGALTIALAALGWWSVQQIGLMEQQLVATQESFARISEDAAGRIQDISGKVVATESTVVSGSEALKLQVRQLEGRLAELAKQQQAVAAEQAAQNKRVEQLASTLKSQQGETAELETSLKSLGREQAAVKSELAAVKGAQSGLSKYDSQLKSLSEELAALKKQGNPNPAIARLEQDILVLKSDLETRGAAKGNTAEFDAFRAQMTRNINTLQAQIQNLQAQLDAR